MDATCLRTVRPITTLWLVAVFGLATASQAGCTDDPGEELEVPDGPDGGPGEPPPANGYCDAVADWPEAWIALENEVLELVNQVRSEGADCGSEGRFEATGPLQPNAALDYAARAHTRDMYERDYFDHQNPDGEQPWDRMERAGYTWREAGENIAGGASTAAAVMAQWMSSDGHCANIMSPGFVHIGVGFHADARLWTQVFGAPR